MVSVRKLHRSARRMDPSTSIAADVVSCAGDHADGALPGSLPAPRAQTIRPAPPPAGRIWRQKQPNNLTVTRVPQVVPVYKCRLLTSHADLLVNELRP